MLREICRDHGISPVFWLTGIRLCDAKVLFLKNEEKRRKGPLEFWNAKELSHIRHPSHNSAGPAD